MVLSEKDLLSTVELMRAQHATRIQEIVPTMVEAVNAQTIQNVGEVTLAAAVAK